MRHILLLMVGLVLAGAAQAVPPPERPPEEIVHSAVLDNGLTVAVLEDNRAERVAVYLCFKVGAFDEPVGKGGLAHAFEHSWFNGSKNMPDGRYSSFLAERGSVGVNAYTMQDRTCYIATVATRYLDDTLWLYSETWQNLELDAARFDKERGAIIAERHARVDNEPYSRFFERFALFHLPDHPYGRPIIGSMDDINGWVLRDLQDWFATNYVPNNAVLVLAGDVTLDIAKELAQKHFGVLKKGTPAFVNDGVTLPRWNAPKRMEPTIDPQVGNPFLLRQYRVPGRFRGVADEPGDLTEAVRIAVAVRLLNEGQTGYLHRRLVLDEKIAQSIGLDYSYENRGESALSLSATPVEGVTLARLEAAIDAALADWLKTAPFTDDELRRLRVGTTAVMEYSKDAVGSRAHILSSFLTAGGTVAQINDWIEPFYTARKDDIMAAARRAFDITQSTTAYLTPSADLIGDPTP